MQIRTRLIAIFASVAVAIAATLGGMLFAENRIHNALDSNTKAYALLTGVSSLVGLATELNAAGLGRVEQQWQVKRAWLDEAITEYQDDPTETKRMSRDLHRADATFHELVKMMKWEMEHGVQLNFMQARLSRYNHLTVLLNNLSTTANHLAAKNYAQVKAVQKYRDISFAGLGSFLCVMMAGWLYVLWRGIRSPLQHLASSIFRVGSGDLDHRVKLNGSSNELSRLMTSYNGMLDRLQELTVSRKHLLDATEQERARIGRELHDGISQTLVGVRLKIETLPQSDTERKHQLKVIANHLTEAQREIQRIVKDLRPAMLDDLGLVETLRWFKAEYSNGRTISLDLVLEEDDIPQSLRTPIYRIVQEATNNAFRHGDASNIHIQLDQIDDTITLFIEDDGIGFDVEGKSFGNGLVNIRERVATAEGELTLDSSPGRGCSLIASFPISCEAPPKDD